VKSQNLTALGVTGLPCWRLFHLIPTIGTKTGSIISCVTSIFSTGHAGLTEKLSEQGRQLINENELYGSVMVRLELQYLYEIQRITENSDTIISDLSKRIGLEVCDKNFNAIITQSLEVSWTRDPFDRIITANAALNDTILLTKDANILENYPHARW